MSYPADKPVSYSAEKPVSNSAEKPVSYSVEKPVSYAAEEVAKSQTSGSPAAESPVCHEASTCSSMFYLQAEALFWKRVGTGCNQVVAIDTDLTPGLDAVMRTSDLEFNAEPGMRFLLGYYPDCKSNCIAWEISYFGVFDWEDGRSVVGPGNLAIPGQLGLDSNNFFLADEIRMHDTSALNNFEVNYVRSCCVCCDTHIDFLMGFRYLNFHDEFSLVGVDLQEGTSSYDIDATNNLFGLQFGGRLRHNCCWLFLELTGKAGIFLNAAAQRQIVTDFPNTPDAFILRNASAHGENAATVAEFGVNLSRRISDNWAIRVGYDALGIGGLALGPDQLDFTDTFISGTTLSKDGYVFIHGAHLGIEACW